MSYSDDLDELYAAIYPAFGELVDWTGRSEKVWILWAAPDKDVGFNSTHVRVETVFLWVRAVEVPAPAEGDVVDARDGRFRVIGLPAADGDRKQWYCQAVRNV